MSTDAPRSIEEILDALQTQLDEVVEDCRQWVAPWGPCNLAGRVKGFSVRTEESYPEILATIRGNAWHAYETEQRFISRANEAAQMLWGRVRCAYDAADLALRHPLPIAQHRLAVLLGTRPTVASEEEVATIMAGGDQWWATVTVEVDHYWERGARIEHLDHLPVGWRLACLAGAPGRPHYNYVIVRPTETP